MAKPLAVAARIDAEVLFERAPKSLWAAKAYGATYKVDDCRGLEQPGALVEQQTPQEVGRRPADLLATAAAELSRTET